MSFGVEKGFAKEAADSTDFQVAFKYKLLCGVPTGLRSLASSGARLARVNESVGGVADEAHYPLAISDSWCFRSRAHSNTCHGGHISIQLKELALTDLSGGLAGTPLLPANSLRIRTGDSPVYGRITGIPGLGSLRLVVNLVNTCPFCSTRPGS